jgi:hypothetical protein
MNADMMEAMPADAMGGMNADMMEAMPADAMGGMNADMMEAMPADATGAMDATQAANLPDGLDDGANGDLADPAVTAAETTANSEGTTPITPAAEAAAVADDPMAGLADFAATNPTGLEATEMPNVVDTPTPSAEPVAPSTFDALETQLDADQTSGGSVAEAAVPEAGTPADAGTEVAEEVTTDAPPATTPDEPIAG